MVMNPQRRLEGGLWLETPSPLHLWAWFPPVLDRPCFYHGAFWHQNHPQPEEPLKQLEVEEEGGGACLFWDCWAALAARAPWAALEPTNARPLAWLNCSWLRMAASTEDINCPSNKEEPMKGVTRSEDQISLQSRKADATTKPHWSTMATNAPQAEVWGGSPITPWSFLQTASRTGPSIHLLWTFLDSKVACNPRCQVTIEDP